jgi:multisubunit Na+/H+ antiporter MnhE subunit
VMTSPALEPLTDVIVLPAWLPFTNIISIGDLLIGVGIAVVIAVAVRAGRRNTEDPGDGPRSTLLDGNSPI